MKYLGKSAFLLAFLFIALNACKKAESPHVSVIPTVAGGKFNFRGFVTDNEEELVSQVYYFSMEITGRDTIAGRPAYRYKRNNETAYFYTDDAGTVWEYSITDIGQRIVAYSFSYRELLIKGWQILLKTDEGEGTEWSASVDTAFEAITLDGSTQVIRYVKEARARFDGWADIFVPEPYARVQVLDAHWYHLNTYFINETTGDTLFATEGSAHHYFDPELGAVKFITDFTKKEIDQAKTQLRGTWELVSKELPE